MTDLNTLVIHGRVVRDVEIISIDTGLLIARFLLASNKSRKLESGEWVTSTIFIPMAVFGKRAKSLAPFIKKGRGLTVEGHLKQNHWDRDGEKRVELAVVVDNILFDPVSKKPEQLINQPVQKDNSATKLANQAMQITGQPQNQQVVYEEPPFLEEEEFYPEGEFDFTPPEVPEGYEIY